MEQTTQYAKLKENLKVVSEIKWPVGLEILLITVDGVGATAKVMLAEPLEAAEDIKLVLSAENTFKTLTVEHGPYGTDRRFRKLVMTF